MTQRLFLLGVLLFSNVTWAVQFIGGGQPIPLKAFSDQDFSVDLRTLLVNPGSATLTWGLTQNPAWLKLDTAAQRIHGRPSLANAGKVSVRLTVQQGDSGSLAQLDISVLVSPQWTQSPIDLGKQPEGTPWTFDLSKVAKHPLNGSLTFSVEDPNQLPVWMSLSSDGKGILSGTPQRKDVGAYQGINFIVSTAEGVTAKVAASGEVLKVIKPPVWLLNPIALTDAQEDFPYFSSLNLSTNVSNPEGAALTFSVVNSSLPPWLSLSPTGVFTGIPGKNDVTTGNGVSLNIRLKGTIDGKDYTADTVVTLKVIHTNHVPKWNASIVQLPDAPTKILYLQDLISHVSDSDGDILTFKILPGSGPAWATVTPGGIFSGIPNNNFLGNNEWSVEVSDGLLTALATVRLKVFNQAPFWLANPTVLPNTKEDGLFSQNLTALAKDPDNDSLTFSLISAPSFISLNGNVISGTPNAANLGLQTLTVQVSDGFNPPVQGTIQFTVDHVNHSPVWAQDPIELPNAPERSFYEKNLASFASDVDAGDSLSFLKLSGPTWVTVGADGKFSGTPQRGDLGINTLRVRVTDSAQGSSEVTVKVTVDKVPLPPRWLNDPTILPNALEDSAYSQNLAKYISNPDAVPVTFSIVSGAPAFISLTNGAFSGTPAAADLGAQSVVVSLNDGTNPPVSSTLKFTVEHVNHAPKWTQNPVVLPNGPERSPYQAALSAFVLEVDAGDTLTFSKVSGPNWVTIEPDGKFSGTPQRANLGVNTLQVRVVDQVGAEAIVTVKVTIDKVPVPPRWLNDPTVLPNALEDSAYSQNLSAFISNPDEVPVTFAVVSGAPAFISLNGSILQGTPKAVDLGPQSIVLTLSDGTNAPLTSTIKFTVEHVNHAPLWAKDPIVLPNAPERSLYEGTLATFASDVDAGDTLTFAKSSGPDWVVIGPDGKLSGTPQRADLGLNNLKVKVTDNVGASTEVTVQVTVIKVPVPPRWLNDPTILPNASEDSLYSQNLASFISNPDSVPVTFAVVSGAPAFISLNASTLSGTPKAADLGPQSIVMTLSDGTNTPLQATVKFSVDHVNHPPTWVQDPIVLPNGPERSLYEAPLKAFASDVDAGDTLTFAKSSGPAWAIVDPDGKLSGTPQRADLGLNTFKVKVSDQVGASKEVTVQVTIDKVPVPPKWINDPTILPNAKEDSLYSQALPQYISNPDSVPLTFAIVSGAPPFISLNGSTVSGTPRGVDLGAQSMVVTFSDGTNPPVSATLKFTVEHVNHDPIWAQDPIVLPNGPEKVLYEANLATFASDTDAGDVLTFTKLSGPAWAKIAVDGKLSGTPQRIDVGVNTLRVRVVDQAGGLKDVTVRVTIEKVNQPPTFVSPLDLGTAVEDALYGYDLRPFASDPDADPLVFKLITGPTWMAVDASGKVTGTPRKADVGPFTATFEVSDGKATAQSTGTGKVVMKNYPPEVVPDSLVFTIKERDTLSVNLNDPKYVADANGDSLSFQVIQVVDWLTLSAAGTLTAKPLYKNIGDYSIPIRISDGKLSVTTNLIIKVIRDPRAPKWTEDPIRFQAVATKPFAASIKDKAIDLDGIALTFSKVSGKDWLTVGADGSLKGTPQEVDNGENSFEVNVKNDLLGVTARVIITVVPRPNVAPKWLVDPILLADANEEVPYSFNIAPYVRDADNDPLTFSKASGPDWLLTSSDGKLSGTPLKPDVGTFDVVFQVNDGRVTVDVRAKIRVLPKIHPPTINQENLFFTMKEREVLKVNLVDPKYIQDPQGLPLVFTLVDKESWVTLTPDGQLTLSPLFKNIGDHALKFTVTNGKLTANGVLNIKVLRDPRAPVWSEDPIRYTAPVGLPFAANLALKVKDLDNLPLTFTKVSGVDWLTVASDGKISGTPEMANLGENTFVVIAANDQKGADVPVIINVVPIKHDPKWTQDPINLGNLPIDKLFEFDLAKYAVDLDGDALIFRMASGPSFLTLRQDGYLSGTPRLKDVGPFTPKFEVSKAIDGVKWIPVNAFGKVIKSEPPTINQTNLVFTVKANDSLNVNLSQPQYVFDPAGSTLTFELQTSLPWVTLSSAGALLAQPKVEHIGFHYLPMKVTNAAGLFSIGTITIKVIKGSEAPEWLQDPIRMVAIVNKPFSNTLVPHLKSQAETTVTFTKQSGTAWLLVAPEGTLSGIPLTENLGENYFIVTATNDAGTKSAVLIVTVKKDQPDTQNDSIQIDEAVAGAEAEQTWVVDNVLEKGNYYSRLVSALRSAVGTFENVLRTAQVHHTGVYLSSDPTNPYYARPLRDAQGDSLMLWSDSNWVTDFNYRVRNSLSVECRNTPIWTLHKFYQQAPGLTSIYKRGFFTEKTPMDVLIITNHADYYKNYSAGTQYRNWNSLDYADEYLEFSKKEKQPYRISAIAPHCTKLQDPLNLAREQTASNNPYRNLVEKTNGVYYVWDCSTDMAKVLADFAEKVKFRAYVSAKKEILLSKTPSDVTKIQVYLSGKLLPVSVWTYDADKNKVLIDWSQIDFSTLKPGDKLEIKYPNL